MPIYYAFVPSTPGTNGVGIIFEADDAEHVERRMRLLKVAKPNIQYREATQADINFYAAMGGQLPKGVKATPGEW